MAGKETCTELLGSVQSEHIYLQRFICFAIVFLHAQYVGVWTEINLK